MESGRAHASTHTDTEVPTMLRWIHRITYRDKQFAKATGVVDSITSTVHGR